MSKKYELSFHVSEENSHILLSILGNYEIEHDILKRKGIDGSGHLIIIVLTASIPVLKVISKIIDAKFKKDMNTSISFDGINIKGVSEKGVENVIKAIAKTKNEKNLNG
ncbi:MAG: hypothetical protein V2B19_20915 [Pseudomonadota bacterium]